MTPAREDEVLLPVRGPFALAASARFLAGFSPLGRPDAADDATLRLAFARDGGGGPAGIALRQEGDSVRGAVSGGGDAAAVAAQAARILSLDIDGSPLAGVAARDPVVAGLVERFDGLRPVLFASPFEAGVWAILSQRTRMSMAARLRERIAEGRREEIEVGGRTLAPFPAPGRLVDLDAVPGLPLVKVEWLRELARAAVGDGHLDAAPLRAAEPQEALERLRELPGVGVFSAELILVRGAGSPDLLPTAETRLRLAVALAYGLPGEPTFHELAAIAEAWRPLRSWVSLLLRAALAEERAARLTAGVAGPHQGCLSAARPDGDLAPSTSTTGRGAGGRITAGAGDGDAWVDLPPGAPDDLAAMARGLDLGVVPSRRRPVAMIAGRPGARWCGRRWCASRRPRSRGGAPPVRLTAEPGRTRAPRRSLVAGPVAQPVGRTLSRSGRPAPRRGLRLAEAEPVVEPAQRPRRPPVPVARTAPSATARAGPG